MEDILFTVAIVFYYLNVFIDISEDKFERKRTFLLSLFVPFYYWFFGIKKHYDKIGKTYPTTKG